MSSPFQKTFTAKSPLKENSILQEDQKDQNQED